MNARIEKERVPKMTLRSRCGKWFVLGDDEPMGPYDTRREAKEARCGVQRYYRHQHEPGFVTSETKRIHSI